MSFPENVMDSDWLIRIKHYKVPALAHCCHYNILQHLNDFQEILLFMPSNPSFEPKCTVNSFAFPRLICPYAGLPVVCLCSKVKADCHLSHYTSPHIDVFLVGLHIMWKFFVFTTKMMFPSLLSLGQIVPNVGNIATDNRWISGKHHFGCRNLLLLALTVRGFRRLLHLPRNGTEQTCGYFCSLWQESPFKVFRM